MRRTETSNLILWGAVVAVVALAAILLYLSGGFQFVNPRQVVAATASVSPTATPTPSPTATATPSPSRLPPQPPAARATAAASATMDLSQLPEVTPPPGGQAYSVVPLPNAAGWARQGDTVANHFGDYNIYAGVYDGQQYIGAIQFGLADVPPGSPITYADLTLVGLATEWLSSEGTWQVSMLPPGMDLNWPDRTFGELVTAYAEAGRLDPALRSADLGAGRANILTFDGEALQRLAERTLTGQVSFRIQGPPTGTDKLFSWDSGYGAKSQGWKPVLRIVAGPAPENPPPAPTVAYILITSTPTPENIVTEAARAGTATAQATTTGTATPLPWNWATPVVYLPTATPANEATAEWQAAEATAYAYLYGSPTPWPGNAWPGNAWTATPRPLVIPLSEITPTPLPPATPVTPPELVGKIAFWSDRLGGQRLFVMNADGEDVMLLTESYPYDAALARNALSPAGDQQAIVLRDSQGIGQIYAYTLATGAARPITALTRPASEPAWGPSGSRIAFVSTQDGNQEIYVIGTNRAGLSRLTSNVWQADVHPSWSPDGARIVFSSNRTAGRSQIWRMNADGTGQVNLSNNPYTDRDPVWLK